MNLIKLSEKVIIDPNEVCSIQEEKTYNEPSSPSDSCMVLNFHGSVLTLKNGRKIYISMMPNDVMEKLKIPEVNL